MSFARQTNTNVAVTIGSASVTFTATEKVLQVWRLSGSVPVMLEEVLLAEMRDQVIPSSDKPTQWAILSTASNSVTIRINASPATAYTLYADVIQEVSDLSGANEPAFPESFHDILIEGVLKDEYRKLEKLQLARDSEATFQRRLSDLRMFVAKSNYLLIQQGKHPDDGTAGRSASGGSASAAVTGPTTPSSTDNAVVRWDGTSGRIVQNSSVIISDTDDITMASTGTLTLPNTGLHLLDSDASHDLIVKPGSNVTADRTLTVTTGDSDRTLTISGDATVSQDYSTSGSPQFTGIELGHATDTTITRSSAGILAVEGTTVPLNSTTNTHTAQQIELGHATDTTLTRSSAGNLAVEGNVVYRAGGTDVALADGGTGATLTDPNADRIMFWDDSAGAVDWLTAGSGLSISGTTITATGTNTDTQPSALRVYTASDTWSKPAGLYAILVWVVGGGGGGGGTANTGASQNSLGAGGGGGGASLKRIAAASLGATETVTVGAAGAAGAAGGGNGGAGGTSSFGAHASATGGAGGTYAAASGSYPQGTAGGGAGGVGSSGDLNLAGGAGGAAFAEVVNGGLSGAGGNSIFGGGASQGKPDFTGTAGGNYGGGGSGSILSSSTTGRAGGAGAAGVVVVLEYVTA